MYHLAVSRKKPKLVEHIWVSTKGILADFSGFCFGCKQVSVDVLSTSGLICSGAACCVSKNENVV